MVIFYSYVSLPEGSRGYIAKTDLHFAVTWDFSKFGRPELVEDKVETEDLAKYWGFLYKPISLSY